MKILFGFNHYPVSIPRYLVEAFRAEGHAVITAGPAFGNYIPWGNGMWLHPHYAFHPDIPISTGELMSWKDVADLAKDEYGAFDAYIIQSNPPFGDGFHLKGSPPHDAPSLLLLTDPHIVALRRWAACIGHEYTHIINMQRCYMYPNQPEYFLPYAYSDEHHFVEELPMNYDVDVACIGIQYPTRVHIMGQLQQRGHKVISQVGLAFDEYRRAHNNAKVCFTWSSQRDTIARVFEGPRMGCALVCNQTPDLNLFFEPDQHVLTFTHDTECIQKIERLLENEGYRRQISEAGYQAAAPHTYRQRVRFLVKTLEDNLSADQHNRRLTDWLVAAKKNPDAVR